MCYKKDPCVEVPTEFWVMTRERRLLELNRRREQIKLEMRRLEWELDSVKREQQSAECAWKKDKLDGLPTFRRSMDKSRELERKIRGILSKIGRLNDEMRRIFREHDATRRELGMPGSGAPPRDLWQPFQQSNY